MLEFTKKELSLMRKLNTPAKVQDFLNQIPVNHEKKGRDTIKSPIRVLREKKAHCIEGALLGAYILSLHGHTPRILHLQATKDDLDHVIAVFKKNGLWGALSKTNHAVLRYREPLYKTIRELVMSYFHEYTTDDGKKTLRSYSKPLDLRVFNSNWMLEKQDLWGVDEELDNIRHYPIASKKVFSTLRLADPIERTVGKMLEWKEK